MAGFYSLSDVVGRTEAVTVEAQQLLRTVMLEILYRKRRAAGIVGCTDELMALEGAGLIVCIDDPEVAMETLGRNELIRRLIALDASGFKKNAKLSDLIVWCMGSGVDVCMLTDGVGVAVLTPAIERSQRKLYTYLVRKFDTEAYFDPESGDMKEVPKGAIFEAVLAATGTSLDLHFPNDELTDLLDRYGCNRCRGWKL